MVKGSQAASNESMLELVQSMLGGADVNTTNGIPLTDFVREYVSESSRELFLDEQGELFACKACGRNAFMVTFSHKTQLPPIVEGKVVCSHCLAEMDPEVG